MARGWRLHDYDRLVFGQFVQRYRLQIGWSLAELSLASGIHKGTLTHVEKAQRSSSENVRRTLVDVLACQLEKQDQNFSRAQFVKVAGIPSAGVTVPLVSVQQYAIPTASGAQPAVEPIREQFALALDEQGAWQQAGALRLLEAQAAGQRGDWKSWARFMSNAAQNDVTRGLFHDAELKYLQVIERSASHEIGSAALADAKAVRGWMWFAQGKFQLAEQSLKEGLAQLAKTLAMDSGTLLLHVDKGAAVWVDLESPAALERCFHYLGRTYSDWGSRDDDRGMILLGLEMLKRSERMDTNLHWDIHRAYDLLRQVGPLAAIGDLQDAEKRINGCGLIDIRGTAQGHIALHRGILLADKNPRRAKEYYENGWSGYTEPIFYPMGLARILMEISVLELQAGSQEADQRALRFALAAVVLHPYGRIVETLDEAIFRNHRWMDGLKFSGFLKGLKEELLRMDTEPFDVLMRRAYFYEPSAVPTHLERALEQIDQAVDAVERL